MLKRYDERRNLAILGDTDEAIQFAAEHWIECAEQAIDQRGKFSVALSGGSTPQPVFKLISSIHRHRIDWSKVWLFWSDERAVLPTHPNSNYRAAMESGFATLPIPSGQIFRMKAESHIEEEAALYEQKIRSSLNEHLFDLVMLGIGDDGHTASLFPQTTALEISDRLVAANYVSSQGVWRMTLTFPCINESRLAVIYVFGVSKSEILKKILQASVSSPWPASRIGTPRNPSLWILDRFSSQKLI